MTFNTSEVAVWCSRASVSSRVRALISIRRSAGEGFAPRLAIRSSPRVNAVASDEGKCGIGPDPCFLRHGHLPKINAFSGLWRGLVCQNWLTALRDGHHVLLLLASGMAHT